MEPLDFSGYIKDIIFGFRFYDGQKNGGIDILDNEFITLKFFYELKRGEGDKVKEDIGLALCEDDNFINKVYGKEEALNKFGSLYCFNDLKQH